MTEQATAKLDAFSKAMREPILCVGGPADGKKYRCSSPGLVVPIQTETERFYYHDGGIHRDCWKHANYQLDRGEDDLPVLQFTGVSRCKYNGKLLLERPMQAMFHGDATELVEMASGGYAAFTPEEVAEINAKLPTHPQIEPEMTGDT